MRDSWKVTMPELREEDVGGAKLPYLFFAGEASGKAMLFVHATGFMPWLWQPVIEEFVPPSKAWAPFICNYRQCDPENGGLGWGTIARDLASLCRLQNIETPLAVGHSMGATVLTIAAALYGVRPCCIVLIEPIFLPPLFYEMKMSVHDHPLAAKAMKRTNRWRNEKEARSYLKSKTLFNGWDEKVLQLYIEHGMQKQQEGHLELTCSPQSEAAIFMGGREINPWPLLEKINCPVLVVEAEESENKQFVDVKKIMALLQKGQYAAVAGAGHLIPMQKPKEIAALIKKFSRQRE